MTGKRLRLSRLEAMRGARAAVPITSNTLYEEAQRVCLALPADLQATVRAGGARGYADLLEAWWETDQGEDLNVSALAAYRLAFGGNA